MLTLSISIYFILIKKKYLAAAAGVASTRTTETNLRLATIFLHRAAAIPVRTHLRLTRAEALLCLQQCFIVDPRCLALTTET